MKKNAIKLFSLLLALLLLAGCGAAPVETTAAPTTVPTTAPAPVFSAEAFADSLTLQQQVAQMFFIHCPAQDAQALIARVQPGGVILFSQNINGKTPDTLRAELESLNTGLPYPLLVAVDEEGGSVSRISSNPSFRLTRFPSPRQAYLDGGEKYLLEIEA